MVTPELADYGLKLFFCEEQLNTFKNEVSCTPRGRFIELAWGKTIFQIYIFIFLISLSVPPYIRCQVTSGRLSALPRPTCPASSLPTGLYYRQHCHCISRDEWRLNDASMYHVYYKDQVTCCIILYCVLHYAAHVSLRWPGGTHRRDERLRVATLRRRYAMTLLWRGQREARYAAQRGEARDVVRLYAMEEVTPAAVPASERVIVSIRVRVSELHSHGTPHARTRELVSSSWFS